MIKDNNTHNKFKSTKFIFIPAFIFLIISMSFMCLRVSEVYAQSVLIENENKRETCLKAIGLKNDSYYESLNELVEEMKLVPNWIVERFVEDEATVELVGAINLRNMVIEPNSVTIGLYHYSEKNPADQFILINYMHDGIEDATIHEFGHYLNIRIYNKISESEEFKKIYESEKEIFGRWTHNEHAVSDTNEYFAETFQYYIKQSEHLKNLCPQTYFFMQKMADEETAIKMEQ